MAQQIQKKFIANGAIDGDKLKLLVGQAVKIEDGNGGTLDLIKLNGQGKVVVKGDVVALQSDLDLIDGRVGVLEADAVSKTYVDGQIVNVLADAESYADGILVDAENYADLKKSEAISAAQTYADGIKSDLLGGVGSAFDTLKELADALANDENAVSALTTTVANNLQTAKDYADAGVLVEKNRAEGAEGLLDGRLDVLEGVGTGSVAKALVDAKAYADGIVATEASARATAVTNAINTAEAYADTKKGEAQTYADGIVATETASRISADDALSGRITLLEGGAALKTWAKEKFTMGSTLTHIDLGHVAVVNSLVVHVGRLGLQLTDDYTVSTVGGVSRLTFAGDFAVGGVEAVAANDVIYVTYQY